MHHYDADGIASAGIVYQYLEKRGVRARTLAVPAITDEVLARIQHEEELILVDLGSGYHGIPDHAIIIDHHLPVHRDGIHFNPHFFGIDGDKEMCGALSAYYIFETDPILAIVGAAGDRQLPLSERARAFLQPPKETTTLNIFGRFSRPLRFVLSSFFDDLPDRLLWSLGINEDKTYEELGESERRKFASFLLLYSIFLERPVDDLLTVSYEFPSLEDKLREAHVFASVLNACGKQGHADVGLNVALYKYMVPEAERIVKEHGRRVMDGLAYAKENLMDLGLFYFLDGRWGVNPGALSAVVSFLTDSEKPIVGVAGRRSLKVSARGGQVSLGDWLRAASETVGGRGGGHQNAAGAIIPEEKLLAFLHALVDDFPPVNNLSPKPL